MGTVLGDSVDLVIQRGRFLVISFGDSTGTVPGDFFTNWDRKSKRTVPKDSLKIPLKIPCGDSAKTN